MKTITRIIAVAGLALVVAYPAYALRVTGKPSLEIRDALSGVDETEMAVLDAVTPGTVTAGKAVVVDANKRVDDLDVTALEIGNIDITSTGTEINYLDGTVTGTVVASKVLAVDQNKALDVVSGVTFYGGTSGSGTLLTSTFTELNKVDGYTGSAANLNLLAGLTAGVAAASKAMSVDANKAIDEVSTPTLYLGASGSGVLVTATGTEINLSDGTVTGTVVASKVIAVDQNKALDVVSGVTFYGGTSGSGTLLTSTFTELNKVDGFTGGFADLNFIDVAAAGTTEASKAVVLDANKRISGIDAHDYWLDGVQYSGTATEWNYLDIGSVGTVVASKAVVADASRRIDYLEIQPQDTDGGQKINLVTDITGTSVPVGVGVVAGTNGKATAGLYADDAGGGWFDLAQAYLIHRDASGGSPSSAQLLVQNADTGAALPHMVYLQNDAGGTLTTDLLGLANQNSSADVPLIKMSNSGDDADIDLTSRAAVPTAGNVSQGGFGYAQSSGGRMYYKDASVIRRVGHTGDAPYAAVTGATITPAAESGSMVTSVVQLFDAGGTALAVTGCVDINVATKSTGLPASPTTAPADAGNGYIKGAVVTGHGLFCSSTSGAIQVSFGQSGSATLQLVVEDSRGLLTSSAAITFSAP